MKKIIVSVLLLTNIYGASAQSLETGIKMVQYERYENAKKELSSINSALANFYTGLALIGQDKVDDAKNIFNKYPTDYINQTGLVRVLFEQKNIETANTLIKSIIDKNKNDSSKLHGALCECPAHRVGQVDFLALQKPSKHLETLGSRREKGRNRED